MEIRTAAPADVDRIRELAVVSAMFSVDEARFFDETSSTDQYALTREFYAKLGYDEEARVRQFYGPNDHKVMFWKSLTVAP